MPPRFTQSSDPKSGETQIVRDCVEHKPLILNVYYRMACGQILRGRKEYDKEASGRATTREIQSQIHQSLLGL